jgi:hypothetical protein
MRFLAVCSFEVRNLNRRQLIGAVALGLLLLLGLGMRYIPGVSQDDWHLGWSVAYVLGLCVAFFAAFYDRKNFPEKTWDFNPRRGILYFFFGWIIFPIMIGIEAIGETDITLSGMVMVTLAMSVLAGILGTFTENIGV